MNPPSSEVESSPVSFGTRYEVYEKEELSFFFEMARIGRCESFMGVAGAFVFIDLARINPRLTTMPRTSPATPPPSFPSGGTAFKWQLFSCTLSTSSLHKLLQPAHPRPKSHHQFPSNTKLHDWR